MIVDASVLLAAFFPDENHAQAQALLGDHVTGQVRLVSPTLLLYEVANAAVYAARRGRVSADDAEAVLATIEELGIELHAVDWRAMLALAREFDRSAYDAAYLALAQARQEPLVTADRRLCNAVCDRLDWVQWIGDRQ